LIISRFLSGTVLKERNFSGSNRYNIEYRILITC
jgi:hypothetical protein